MMGERSAQDKLFAADHIYLDFVGRDTLYGYLAQHATLRKGEEMIESCEHCNPTGAEIPFDWILDRITDADSSVTDYILEEPAKCRTVGMLSLKKR